MDRPPQIVLQRKALEHLLADGNTAQKIAKRARIVLMSADGHRVMAIKRELGVSKTTVWRWQEYFVEAGVESLIKAAASHPASSRSAKPNASFRRRCANGPTQERITPRIKEPPSCRFGRTNIIGIVRTVV